MAVAALQLLPFGCGDDGAASVEAGSTATSATETVTDSEDSVGPGPGTMSSSSTTPTETGDPTSDTETTDDPTETGPTGCMGPGDCPMARPFCIEQSCVDCSQTPDGDAACADADPGAPVCDGTVCVQCTDADMAACDGTTPICDVDAQTCVACNYHFECQDIGLPACHIAEGSCFPDEAPTEISAGDNDAIQTFIDGMVAGEQAVIIVTGVTGDHTITVNNSKTLALLGQNEQDRTIEGNAGAPTLTAVGADVHVYTQHLIFSGNTTDVGVQADNNAIVYLDETQVSQNDGGGVLVENDAEAVLRNTLVVSNGDGLEDTTGLRVDGAVANVVASTFAFTNGSGAQSLQCSGGSSVEVRSSILLGEDPSSVDCAGGTITFSAIDEGIPGEGNVNVIAFNNAWFVNLAAGDAHLTALGETLFADVGQWETGDPPFDIDGDPRPNVDGASDVAGIDVP